MGHNNVDQNQSGICVCAHLCFQMYIITSPYPTYPWPLTFNITVENPHLIIKNGAWTYHESKDLQQETYYRFSGDISCGTHFPNSEIFPILCSWRDAVVWETLNWCASSLALIAGLSVMAAFNRSESSFLGRPHLASSSRLKFPFRKRENHHLQLRSFMASIP